MPAVVVAVTTTVPVAAVIPAPVVPAAVIVPPANVTPVPPPRPNYQKAYYVDATLGSDANDGRSPATAWKTLAKVRSSRFVPGDAVLLKAGETFNDWLRLEGTATASAPIVVASYGAGARPILSGFTPLSAWTSRGNGVWESPCAPCGARVGVVSVNGAMQPMGRFPKARAANSGYLTIGSHDANRSITDTTYSHSENWTGGELVIRTIQYLIDRYPITQHSGATFAYTTRPGGSVVDDFGYFIQNHPKTLTQPGTQVGEWYYDPVTKKLQMYFGAANPASYAVKAGSIASVVDFSNLSHITLDNLSIEGAGAAGINVLSSVGLRIQNADVRLSGTDAISGITVRDLTLENVAISDAGNNGVDLIFVNNVVLRNNKLDNIGIAAGGGRNGDGNYIGITLGEVQGALIAGNVVTNTGYNGISVGGDSENITIENNYVVDVLRVKNDGAAIYTYFTNVGTANSVRKIRNNVVLNGHDATDGTNDKAYVPAHGIYLDGHTSFVEVTGNTAANFPMSGLFVNTANDITATGNTFFNNGAQVLMLSYHSYGSVRNTVFSGNVLFSKAATSATNWISTKKATQPGLLLRTEMADDFAAFGQFNGNYYVSPLGDEQTVDTYALDNGTRPNRAFSLQGWQTTYGRDLSSRKSPLSYPAGTDFDSRVRFEYNATIAPKQVVLDGNYVDAKGAARSGTLVLQPYASVILMK